MKSNSTNTFLTIVLVVSLIWSVVSCLQVIFQTRELRQLAEKVGQINVARQRMQVVVGVAMDYSKTNTAIDPILESVRLDPKAARAAAKNATK